MHDLVIRNGLVVDGSGSPAREADVAVDGGSITTVGAVAPDAEAEWRHHGFECSAFGTEHHCDANMHHPNTRLRCRFGGRFPLAAHVRQEASSLRAVFPKNFLASVAVVSHR